MVFKINVVSNPLNRANFITAADNGAGGTLLSIDHDGVVGGVQVSINLAGVAYTGTLLDAMVVNGNMVL